jgi:organic radical activating enzyme
MTDGCNKNCEFCLNDFQNKPLDNPTFVEPMLAIKAIETYAGFMKALGQTPVVTFSGGEPGIHPEVHAIVRYAKMVDAVTKVVTNGTAFFLTELHDAVDCWHISVNEIDRNLLDFIKRFPANVQIQHVVQNHVKLWSLVKLVHFYGKNDLPMKLWIDFFARAAEKKEIQSKIETVAKLFKNYEIRSRFTGKQENRGRACRDCKLNCVTLKALWVFPDGTASSCPQGVHRGGIVNSWIEVMKEAYVAHRWEE